MSDSAAPGAGTGAPVSIRAAKQTGRTVSEGRGRTELLPHGGHGELQLRLGRVELLAAPVEHDQLLRGAALRVLQLQNNSLTGTIPADLPFANYTATYEGTRYPACGLGGRGAVLGGGVRTWLVRGAG